MNRFTVVAALAACSSMSVRPTASIRSVDWMNRSYAIDGQGTATVERGRAELRLDDDGHIGAEGAFTGSYAIEPPRFADLDGDGAEEAIILSVLDDGGTGRYSSVDVVGVRAGSPVRIATIEGGDRLDEGIEGVRVIERRGVVLRRRGPEVHEERWQLSGGAIRSAD
jgi:hypothetical protein